MDVHNTFLNGDFHEKAYIDLPKGLDVQGTYGSCARLVCKLNKSLYGLKQASRQWNDNLTSRLLGNGFKQSYFDYCFFTKGSGDNFIVIFVYVDDLVIASKDSSVVIKFKGSYTLSLRLKI